MDKREYLRVVQVGNGHEVMRALREETDFRLTLKMLDSKIAARAATKFKERSDKKPVFRFGPKFMTKLSLMPAVSIEVNESRSHIRKTCYGFRCKKTGERVYLRIDWPGSVVEFRDSPSGYLLGKRYLIPNLHRMRDPTWRKVNRKMTRLLSQGGIIVTASHVDKYQRSLRARSKLAMRLIMLRMKYLPVSEYKREWARNYWHAKTKHKVS